MRELPSRRIRVAGGVVIAAGLVVAALTPRLGSGLRAVLWSALMLSSFVGWGSLANLWLARDRWMDWGLRAGWGLGLFVLTGGVLCGAHLAVRPVLVAHVGGGVLALLVVTALRRSTLPSSTYVRRRVVVIFGRAGTAALILGTYAMAVFTFLAFLGNHSFQPSDDPPFYFALAEKLMQTGSMFEPFMVRRVQLFGGQVYLHASFISVASIYYLHAVDGGISFIVVVALLVGHVGRSSGAWRAAALGLAVLLLFSLLDVRVNTNSLMSGVAAVMTLYRTVRVPFGLGPERPKWPMEPRRVCALAALTLVCILLRTSNAPGVLLFVAFVFVSDFVLGARWPWTRETLRSVFRILGLLVGTFVLALLPWSILQKQSSGTYFYPFGHNNVTPGWTFLTTPKNLGDEGRELLSHLFHGRPVALFVPFVIAGLVPLAGRARNDLACLSLGSLFGLAVFSHQAVAFGPSNTARYYFAFVVATSLLIAASAAMPVARAGLVAAALALHLVSSREDTRGALDGYVTNAYHALIHSEAFDAVTADYLDVQSHVPPGATMATAVFEGFRFDFKRNTIFSLDVLGGMGPSPGWPAHQGPEALGTYFLANGIRYLVWVDFNLPSEFYNRAHWTTHLSKAGTYLQGEAVLQLDAEDSIEKLTAMRRVVYRAHGMTVVDLAAAQ